MKKLLSLISLIAFPLSSVAATPQVMVVDIHSVSALGIGPSIGEISLTDSPKGLVVTPKLTGLPPGDRGFHVHEKPLCDPGEKDGKMQAALAAGSHYDPQKAGTHSGPDGHGHTGDLPTLKVAADGTATTQVIAQHLKLSELIGRTIVIHSGGDNYSDQPAPLGGGGDRIACGSIGGMTR